MPYYNNIPKPLDRIYLSQDEILQNFQIIPQLIDENHINFDIAGQGKHPFVSIPIRDTAPATNSTEVALYSKLGQFSRVPELWVKRKSNPPTIGAEYCFTELGRSNVTGWARLQSGILIKWGRFTTEEMGLTDPFITYTVGYRGIEENFPIFQAVFDIKITPYLEARINSTFGAWPYLIYDAPGPLSPIEYRVKVRKTELGLYRVPPFEIYYIATGV